LMMDLLIKILFLVLFIYVALSVLYLFVFSMTGSFFYRKRRRQMYHEPLKRIAILVPAYKEDGIILSTASNLLNLNYPSHLYDVYILADSFQEESLEKLKQMPINLFEVSFDKSTKTKSLNEGFRRINKEYDVALICDADNILAKDFLLKINEAFLNGAKAVQGRRVAKNLDTSFAILDACSEGINNTIFRKGPNAIGLSSSVIGSGMAFEFSMLKSILGKINAVGGFDKILQLDIVARGIKIQYLDDAIIFDEKVDSSHAFKQQRKRWVSSQFIYLKRFFFPAFKYFFKGNLSYFNLAIANNIVLPRAFLLLILPVLFVAAFFISQFWVVAVLILVVLFLVSMIFALPKELVNRDLFYAALRLPKAVIVMAGTIFQIKKANKTFIHTVHTKTEVSNTLFKDHGN
jgi:cellulose synthase/poly-beta-1,6-N-acetylglucosamine synthase-like glycosyltransferase